MTAGRGVCSLNLGTDKENLLLNEVVAVWEYDGAQSAIVLPSLRFVCFCYALFHPCRLPHPLLTHQQWWVHQHPSVCGEPLRPPCFVCSRVFFYDYHKAVSADRKLVLPMD